VRGAAPLGADLDHALVRARGGEHRLALADVDADRLLHVDVRTRLDCGDHRQRMPMVGGGDEDHVEVLLREHQPVILVAARLLLRFLPAGDQLDGILEHAAVDIAQRDHLHRRHLDKAQQIAFAVPAAAD
jgi:hypothetical protein